MKQNKSLFFQYTHDYLNKYLRNQTSKSENTIESYKDALTIFRKFLLEVKKIKLLKFNVEDCTKELILDFIEYLNNNGRQTSTINHHVTVIKNYLWYISDIDITYQSVAISVSHIPSLRIPIKEKGVLSNEVLKLLFEAPKANKKGIRNQAIMILLYETAIRVGELINLDINDLFLNVSTPYMLVHGKGNKERIVSISSKAVEHLVHYINVYKPKEYLFYSIINGNKNRLSESTIETFIQKYAKEIKEDNPNIDIPLKIHPHMFRRTRATHLYQDGIPIELISKMLGHASTETTRKHYAKPSLEQMKKIIENENDIDVLPEWDDEDEIARNFGIR